MRLTRNPAAPQRPRFPLVLVALALLAVGHPRLAAAAVQWPVHAYHARVYVSDLLATDLDRDGLDDLILLHGNVHTGSVVLTGPDGRPRFPGQPFGSFVGGVHALGDLNADGVQDLLHGHSGAIAVWLADGSGGLVPGGTYPLATPPSSLAVADVNRDGALDLVTTQPHSYEVTTWIGTADGGLASPLTLAYSDRPLRTVLGDFDGDSLVDLRVWSQSGSAFHAGRGDGTWEAPVAIAGRPEAYAAHAVDLDHDGRLDVVRHGEDSILVELGNGDGTFTPGTVPTTDLRETTGFSLADFDQDGWLDLVFAGRVHRGMPGGVFAPPEWFGTGGFPEFMATGDLDGDGALEVISASGTVVAVHDPRQPVAAYPTPMPWPGLAGASDLLHGDFDGDQIPDVLALNSQQYGAAVLLLRGTGMGTLESPIHVLDTRASIDWTAADFDADGALDVALSNYDWYSLRLQILGGDGDGRFAVLGQHADVGGRIRATDVNGDSRLDLVVTNASHYSILVEQTVILLGSGDGTFAAPRLIWGGPVAGVADMDLDGKRDFLGVDVSSGWSGLVPFRGNGDGTFALVPAQWFVEPDLIARGFTSAALEDVNRDQKPDLVLFYADTVAVMLGAGNFEFLDSPWFLNPGKPGRGVVFDDLNGDGHVDMLTGGRPVTTIWLGDGTGRFHPEQEFVTWGEVTTGDMDRDGLPEVLLAHSGAGVYVMPNLSAPTPVLLAHFTARRAGDAVEVRWRFADAMVADVAVERSERPDGPWTAVAGHATADASGLLLLDGSAPSERPLHYRLVVTDRSGARSIHGPILVAAIAPPAAFGIRNVSPNPSRGHCLVEYAVRGAGRTRLEIVDVQGRVVATLLDRDQDAGVHQITWNQADGPRLAPGIYLVHLRWRGERWSRRIFVSR